ncbi:VOC family protein [Crenalkalicoccus roseus]|uniref:VOC family protein n=1 Tax=Crenalkalicoccus roseus TaxID=1485588 RepID=UPI0013051039|nr:VOC family protein [Crenalkalicoccus roseus]
MGPLIDHVVVDVRDRMEEGARRYRALGFTLTPLGRHSLGSANHLAIFGRDYLELLGTDVPGGALRPDLAGYPVGLNGLVFLARGAEALQQAQQARGVPVQGVVNFFRPVEFPDGTRADARFNVVRLDPAAAFDGRMYWCEHLTPENVWRAEWQDHPNGATGIARVLLSVRDPARQAALFTRIFGPGHLAEGPGGRRILKAGDAVVEFAPHAAVREELGAAAPDPAERGDHMVLVGLRVRDLARTAEVLRANGVAGVEEKDGRLRVPASEAMNATIDFMA